MKDDQVLFRLLEIFNHFIELKINLVIVPLFGASELKSEDSDLISNLKKIVDKANDLNLRILLETDMPTIELLMILDDIGNPDVGIVYDIGNATFSGKNIPNDFELLFERIKHIHIKDKDNNGLNVPLGTGLVDFNNFFHLLNIYNYQCALTLETSRGDNALAMATRNINFLKDYFFNYDK